MKKLKKWLVGGLVVLMSTSVWGQDVVAADVEVITEEAIKQQVEQEIKQETKQESKEEVKQETKQDKEEGLEQVKSYEELVEILKEGNHFFKSNGKNDGRVYLESSNTQDIAAGGASTGINYSETNKQVEGVDEADKIKVDGRYIYAITEGESIAIVDTQNGMHQVASISYDNKNNLSQYSPNKIFLDKKYLTVVLSNREYPSEDQRQYRSAKRYMVIQAYDISDKSKPVLKREVKVAGNESEVRKIENQIYLVTNKTIGRFEESQYEKTDVLPTYMDTTANSELQTIDVKDISYYKGVGYDNYTVLTTFNIDNKEKPQFKVLMGNNNELYMNEKAIYLAESVYEKNRNINVGSQSRTYITKYSIKDKTLKYEGTKYVPGELLNQFSMDEYKGYFRLATNDNKLANSVYILNQDLEVVGKLEGMAKGERIYSVRFDGDRGYVVTFKQVDPLFVIDLSKPTAPKVLGELKVPGFSQYLHPIGDNLVIGIGRSTVENIQRDETGKETVVGIMAAGIKLSLFDVSNAKSPVEINHIILGSTGSWSEALENHNAVMVDKKRHILAMPVSLEFANMVQITSNVSAQEFQGAYVFGIENGKLVGKAKLGKVDANTGEYMAGYSYGAGRVCYIGDKMYYVYDKQMNVYNMDNFKLTKTITLD